MTKNMTRDEMLLINALRIADQHKKTCTGLDCNVSLSLLLELLTRAGIIVPEDKLERFL